MEAAQEVGRGRSPRAAWTLVYGGAAVGLMGALADAALSGGRQGGRRDPKGAGRARDRASRSDRAARGQVDARAQGDDGRPLRCFPRAAGRRRDAGGDCSRPGPGRSSATTANRSACSTSTASSTPLVAFLDHQCRERFMRREHRDMLIVESDPNGCSPASKTIGRRSSKSGSAALNARASGSDHPGLGLAPAGRRSPIADRGCSARHPDQRPRRSAGSQCTSMSTTEIRE